MKVSCPTHGLDVPDLQNAAMRHAASTDPDLQVVKLLVMVDDASTSDRLRAAASALSDLHIPPGPAGVR